MDGVTDFFHRDLLTRLFSGRSGLSLCVSEFVRITDQLLPDKVFLASCPELNNGGRTEAGVPVQVQLLGGRPEFMARNAARVAELGAPGVDLNFGCPARTVNNHDGGAAILREPARVAEITRAVVAAVPSSLPVSVKVRTGWEHGDEMVDIARAAEDGGARWLTVHGRTRKQLYAPPVDWRAIGRAREAISIPVVANGDLYDLDSLRRCAAVTGCAAFMVGRGAMAHPDLFARVRGWRSEPLSTSELCAAILDYCKSARSTDPTEDPVRADKADRRLLGRLKQWLRMAAAHREDMKPRFDEIKRLRSLDAATALLGAL
jgi:tRNA-dihydrouridine synthase C